MGTLWITGKFISYIFNMQRLDKIPRKKYPNEMVDQSTFLLVRRWMSNNVGINICGDPTIDCMIADQRIRYLIKHPELLIKELSNQSQSVQDNLSVDDTL